jgi:hypothetical protein
MLLVIKLIKIEKNISPMLWCKRRKNSYAGKGNKNKLTIHLHAIPVGYLILKTNLVCRENKYRIFLIPFYAHMFLVVNRERPNDVIDEG